LNSPLKVAIAGLGNVGVGVVKILEQHKKLIADRAGREIFITTVCAQNRAADRGIDISAYVWAEDVRKISDSDDVDIVVELIGGNQFKTFRQREDYNEYLEIKEDREKLREEIFNKIMAKHCKKHGILDRSEIVGNAELYEPLVKELVNKSGFSLRKIAKILEVSYSSVQKVCSSK
jgi:hypothetical protein